MYLIYELCFFVHVATLKAAVHEAEIETVILESDNHGALVSVHIKEAQLYIGFLDLVQLLGHNSCHIAINQQQRPQIFFLSHQAVNLIRVFDLLIDYSEPQVDFCLEFIFEVQFWVHDLLESDHQKIGWVLVLKIYQLM